MYNYILIFVKKTLLTLLLIFLLVSNALTIRRDKSILFSRIVIKTFFLAAFLAYNNIHIKVLENGVGIDGGLFNVTTITQSFNIFMLLISGIILSITAFFPKKVYVKKYASIRTFTNMSLITRLGTCFIIGISTLPMKVILCIHEIEYFLPLVIGLQAVLTVMFFSIYTDKKIDSLYCFMVFIVSVISSVILVNLIYDVFTHISLMELCNVLLNAVLQNAEGPVLTLSMNIGDLLNPAPQPSAGSSQGGSQGTNPPQTTAGSSQDASQGTNPPAPSNVNTNIPLDISSNRAFGNSLEARCRELSLTKQAGYSGIVSITLKDLGITKHSPEWNTLTNVVPKPDHDLAVFDNAIYKTKYKQAVIWSTSQTGHSPGSSITDRIKNA